MSAAVFLILKGEMRPLLCQCVIITSLHADSSEPFSFVNIFPDLMFSSGPCLGMVCCNRALHPRRTHTDDFNERQAKSNSPLTLNNILQCT